MGSGFSRFLLLAAGLLTLPLTVGLALDANVHQLVVSVAPDWNTPVGKLQLFERDGKSWKAISAPIRVLYGKNGLAWGKGILGTNEPGLHKAEKDKRAPAGVFKIGTIYTYDRSLPGGSSYPIHTITEADAWIDDPTLPNYNQHITVDLKNPPPWYEKQKMRLDDPPHRWLVEIRHNSDPPTPGDGSAIFFHIQRGPDRYSAGCTVMPETGILKIIQWLKASDHPEYALLPKNEYLAKWKAWGLPSPEEAATLLGN